MGVGVADYDCDGWFDIFRPISRTTPATSTTTTATELSVMLRFSSGIGINNQYVAWGCGFIDADAGRKRNITESSVAVVVVEVAGVVREIGLENVEPPVAVVVRDSNSHPRLLVAVFTVCATGYDRNIGECPIVIVVKQNARLRIYRHVNVRPSVIV